MYALPVHLWIIRQIINALPFVQIDISTTVAHVLQILKSISDNYYAEGLCCHIHIVVSITKQIVMINVDLTKPKSETEAQSLVLQQLGT